MAHVFKRRRRRNGQIVISKKYTIQWHDADGVYHRQTAFTDKGKSWELARKLEQEAQATKQQKYLNTPLVEQVACFRRSLEAKQRSPKHIRITCSRVKMLLEGCGFIMPADVGLAEIEQWLGSLKKVTARTRNYYINAAKQFFSWLIKAGLATSNPLATFEKLNTHTDIRRVRRVLSADEMNRLIDVAWNGEPYRGVSGQDRAILYLLAVRTGLRASECASLTSESFRLDTDPPTVTVAAAYSKRRRTDTLPLRSDLANLLTGWLRGRTGLLWPGTWLERSARMIRKDLDVAGIPYKTVAGVFDFHSLRHQFLSDLASSGVHPKVAQELARHSTITLTMDRYSHVLEKQKTDALESLPSVGEGTQKGTQARVSEGLRQAQPVTTGGDVPFPALSMEPYVVSVVSTDCHESSLSDSSSGGRSRTYDTRIMISSGMFSGCSLGVTSARKHGVSLGDSRHRKGKGIGLRYCCGYGLAGKQT
jgi:integrase